MFARSFPKTLFAGLLAATIALTSIAPTQATAQNHEDDVIVGLITLLLLGAALSNGRDTPAPEVHRPRRDDGWRVLPAQCRREHLTDDGRRVRMFGRACLRNNYNHMNRLPDRCFARIRNDRGQVRRGWRVRCLRNEGFRVNRH